MSHASDAAAVKARLIADLESFLRHLFPQGKVRGHCFHVGSLAGEPGDSLAVELRGPKAGLWVDRNGRQDSGDIFTLAERVWNLPFVEMLGQCRSYLGMSHVETVLAKPRPPKPDLSPMQRMLGTPVHAYLRGRRLSDEAMQRYRLRSYARRSQWNEHHVGFSYYTPDGQLVMVKTLGIKRIPSGDPNKPGKKDIWSTPPYWTLFGWWLVKPHHRVLLVQEGEADCISASMMLDADIPCLSVPNGSNGCEWIDNDYDALRQFETIYVNSDNDPAGDDLAKEIARRLGRIRVKRVRCPAGFKDANDVLCRGDDIHCNVDAWIADAESFAPASLVRPSDIEGDFMKLRARQRDTKAVNTFVFPRFAFQFRDGETSLFSGYPESGKSSLLYQTHLHEMRLGNRCLLCSFEIKPEEMLRQLTIMMGVDEGGDADNAAMDALRWLNEHLVFIRPPDPYPFETLCEDIAYAVARFAVRRVAIDSLHYLASKDDYEGQDRVVRMLHRFNGELMTHLALVAHSPKVADMKRIPGMMDVEGSGGIIKPVDNIVVCHRNIDKEEKLAKASDAEDQTKMDEAKKLHDGLIVVRKQRLTGKHPILRLWLDENTKTFRDTAEVPPPPEEGNQKEIF